MTSAGKGQYATFKAHLDYLAKYGEKAADGRPSTCFGGRDELLHRLYAVHNEPRYDTVRHISQREMQKRCAAPSITAPGTKGVSIGRPQPSAGLESR